MISHTRIAATAALCLLLAAAPAPAWAASPDTPVLVAPADGSTSVTGDIPLAVTVTDPDGGPLDVRFEGRMADTMVPGTGSGDPFTLVALPDVQNYTYSNRQGTIVQQAQWVVDTRAELNTAMVVQLGDLVSEYANLTQWGHTSNGLRVLDDAGVPNTVIAGNHDFNNVTGSYPEYDTYFPPSRYAGKPWVPSTASYGGYMGQNLFGPDPVDRGNMNNFALFSAGGRDFLVLNFEWEPPQSVLTWGARVLAAHPDRIAILTTHSFVQLNGTRRVNPQRPGGTSAETMWNTFVSQQCSIKLVIGGHYHNGDLGEAHRSDLNRCGEPVHQILADYQARANGGDGWLQYYTFDPVADTMTATTYSPKLNQYETDADSAFTLPFTLGTPQPASFQEIDTVQIASGATATTTWTELALDSAYEWRAVVSDGTSSKTSQTWTVRTPRSPHLVDDTFTRTLSGEWGTADAGGHAWTTTSTASSYSVDGSVGRITTPVGSGRRATLTGANASDVRITTDLAVTPAATGSGTYVSVMGRVQGSNSYRAKLRFLSNGGLSLTLVRFVGAGTDLVSTNLAGVADGPGKPIRVRLELKGFSPTTLRAKAWRADAPEPAAWAVSTTDSTPALQSPGSFGLDMFTSSSAAAASVLAVDRFTATELGSPPGNTPPTAAITQPQIDGLVVDLNGTASNDPDGTITSYAWSFGDNATGTGPAPTHRYATAGTYTITLTVTDNSGATGTATTQVTVTAPPPVDGLLAKDSFERTITNGWGTADTGGSWTTTGTTGGFSVSSGTGKQAISTLGTTASSAMTSVSSVSTDLRVSIAWSRASAAGSLYTSLIPRRVTSANDYRCKVVATAKGSMQLHLVRRINGVETTLSTTIISGLTQAANQSYELACRAVPSGGSTQISGKLWRTGTTEPATWQATTNDNAAGLQTAGGIGISSYLSRSATTGVTLTVDNLTATNPAP